jgi:hypothetical protein
VADRTRTASVAGRGPPVKNDGTSVRWWVDARSAAHTARRRGYAAAYRI